MNKVVICFGYLFVILGLWFSDDLYQNNDEKLLIPKGSSTSQSSSKKVVVLYFESFENKTARIEEAIDEFDIDYKVISLHNFFKFSTWSEVEQFFLKFPKLKKRLVDSNGLGYILAFEGLSKRSTPKLVSKLADSFSRVRISSLSALNMEIGKTTLDIKKIVLPSLLLLCGLFLFLLTRSLALSLLLFLYPLFNIPLSLVLLKIIYRESNLLSSLSPLVSFVISFCLIIHLLYSSVAFDTFEKLKVHKMKPIIFMLFTTVLGIFSLYYSNVPAIKYFSLISGLTILIGALVTVVSFKFLYHQIRTTTISLFRLRLMPPKLNKGLVTCVLVLPFLLFFFSFEKLRLQVEALHFFPDSFKIVKDTKYIEKNIVGTPLLSVVIPKLYILEDYSKANLLLEVEHELSTALKDNSSLLSPLQSIRDANYIYSGSYQLPTSKFAAAALFSKSPSLLAVDSDYRIQILGHSMETDQYFDQLSVVIGILNKHNISYRLEGDYYKLMSSQSDIIRTLSQSFLISLILISIVVGFYLRNIKDFAKFLIINLAPPICTLVLFGILDLSLNLATIMTFSISFGLIVDSTLHVIYAQITRLSEQESSLTVFMPILVSSVILMSGFAVFSLHYFLPIWQFGMSICVTILFGFLYDFFILPNLSSLKRL